MTSDIKTEYGTEKFTSVVVRENVEFYFCLAGMLVSQCTCKFISRTAKRLNVWQMGLLSWGRVGQSRELCDDLSK